MQYFPLFLDLVNKNVLVVGGGEVASRKIEALVKARAKVTIVSPRLSDYLISMVNQNKCVWLDKEYEPSVLQQPYIQVWATTNDPALNHRVYKEAKLKGYLVNVVDDKPYCDFITPSMITRGKIQVAISSGGASPVLVRNIRERVESLLAQNIELLADFASSKRDDIKSRLPNVDTRRLFWEQFFANPKLELVTSMQELEHIYNQQFESNRAGDKTRVWIEYGADVELLSIKSLRLMQKAELIIHPTDIPEAFVELCRRDAERESYNDSKQLNDLLARLGTRDLNSICIFLAKGSPILELCTHSEYQQDTLLKVVG